MKLWRDMIITYSQLFTLLLWVCRSLSISRIVTQKSVIKKNCYIYKTFANEIRDLIFKPFANKEFISKPIPSNNLRKRTFIRKKRSFYPIFVICRWNWEDDSNLAKISTSIKVKLPFSNLHVLFNFLGSGIKIMLSCTLTINFKFSCGRCNATYCDKTCRYLKCRVGKHSIVSPFTRKKSESKKNLCV